MNVNKSIGSENLFQDGSAKEVKDFFFSETINHKLLNTYIVNVKEGT